MRHDLHSAGFLFRLELGLAPALAPTLAVAPALALALCQGQSECRGLTQNVSSLGSLQMIMKTKLGFHMKYKYNDE